MPFCRQLPLLEEGKDRYLANERNEENKIKLLGQTEPSPQR